MCTKPWQQSSSKSLIDDLFLLTQFTKSSIVKWVVCYIQWYNSFQNKYTFFQEHFGNTKMLKKHNVSLSKLKTGWWFQRVWKILVKPPPTKKKCVDFRVAKVWNATQSHPKGLQFLLSSPTACSGSSSRKASKRWKPAVLVACDITGTLGVNREFSLQARALCYATLEGKTYQNQLKNTVFGYISTVRFLLKMVVFFFNHHLKMINLCLLSKMTDWLCFFHQKNTSGLQRVLRINWRKLICHSERFCGKFFSLFCWCKKSGYHHLRCIKPCK